jgi:hypothetical protein
MKKAKTYDCVGYLCGPITAKDLATRRTNLHIGIDMASAICQQGIPMVSPHALSKEVTHHLTWEECLSIDLALLKRCQFVLAIDGWKDSRGCRLEVAYAHCKGIPVFYQWEELKCFVESNYTSISLEDMADGYAACLEEI